MTGGGMLPRGQYLCTCFMVYRDVLEAFILC